ncbi:hypothetical protein LTR56_015995 [Elasticomyces elasticus]|nr:hypothetical protein LTR22_025204 [Elasticomyces elasticus]KAK3633081.1 hypothetical protein LTR56_015995 [Elasticomyces elasticus]KAK4917927.1 hypothetical protein LTR49_014202 [Elasticomyces elasticus]KAK5753323.1 hypothetical protein LTS12_016566 [Elasticomyces elasticus]
MADHTMIEEEDDYIAVMGLTGSGKSTFISKCTGEPPLNVGHGLESCTRAHCPQCLAVHLMMEADTKKCTLHTIQHKGRTVHLLDTPGFNDTYDSNQDVFLEVAHTLITAYKLGIKVTGIIYLQSMTDVRMQGSAVRSLRLLEALCGVHAYSCVSLTATHCKIVPIQERQQKLLQLRSNPTFWGNLYEGGSSVVEFADTKKSALSIIDTLLEKGPRHTLCFQRQMVDDHLTIDDTDAGKVLHSEWSAAVKDLRKQLNEMQVLLQQSVSNAEAREARQVRDDAEEKVLAKGRELAALDTTAETLGTEWHQRIQAERDDMDSRIGKLEDTITKLRNAGRSNALEVQHPPPYNDELRRFEEQQKEMQRLEKHQLFKHGLELAKKQKNWAAIGGVGGLAALGVGVAPFLCATM